ncbi:MAG: hypothetical protein IT510_06760, partial [Sulfuritalea sp.]|nr:hypothetical protein [Sulfuritalea sp.]
PQTGDKTTWEGWQLEVVDLDGKRVDKVLASKLPEENAAPDGTPGSTDNPSQAGNG